MAQRKRQPMDAIAQAAIEAYLDALEAADDQGPGLVDSFGARCLIVDGVGLDKGRTIPVN